MIDPEQTMRMAMIHMSGSPEGREECACMMVHLSMVSRLFRHSCGPLSTTDPRTADRAPADAASVERVVRSILWSCDFHQGEVSDRGCRRIARAAQVLRVSASRFIRDCVSRGTRPDAAARICNAFARDRYGALPYALVMEMARALASGAIDDDIDRDSLEQALDSVQRLPQEPLGTRLSVSRLNMMPGCKRMYAFDKTVLLPNLPEPEKILSLPTMPAGTIKFVKLAVERVRNGSAQLGLRVWTERCNAIVSAHHRKLVLMSKHNKKKFGDLCARGDNVTFNRVAALMHTGLSPITKLEAKLK